MHMNKQARQSARKSAKKSTKKQYHIRNWHDYNEALVRRGSLEVWISEEAMDQWYAEATGEPGAQPLYSDLAITTALTVEKVFHLPLRGAEGFMGSVFRMTEVEL